MQIYFRSPKELLTKYFENLKNVIEFQQKHGCGLGKIYRDMVSVLSLGYCLYLVFQYNKAVKAAKDLQASNK